MADAAASSSTHNALPWIEQCLESLAAPRRSSSTTARPTARVAFVRERFPEVRLSSRRIAVSPRAGRRDSPRSSAAAGCCMLNADAWLVGGCARADGRASATRTADVRRRRPEAAQPGRVAAALGARLPDPLAARDRVFLPSQARPADGGAERVLRRGLRPRVRAGGRMRDGRLHARPPHRDRRGRPARPELLPLQRGGRLVLPLRAGGLEDALHARRRPASTSAAPRTAAASTATTCAGTSASSSSTTGRRGGAGAVAAAPGALASAAVSSAARRGRCTATPPAGSAPATSAR